MRLGVERGRSTCGFARQDPACLVSSQPMSSELSSEHGIVYQNSSLCESPAPRIASTAITLHFDLSRLNFRKPRIYCRLLFGYDPLHAKASGQQAAKWFHPRLPVPPLQTKASVQRAARRELPRLRISPCEAARRVGYKGCHLKRRAGAGRLAYDGAMRKTRVKTRFAQLALCRRNTHQAKRQREQRSKSMSNPAFSAKRAALSAIPRQTPRDRP